jgi:hypothetical protein
LRIFENRVLRRIFGPKREEVAGGWRRLHNEELHNYIFMAWYSVRHWDKFTLTSSPLTNTIYI